MKENTVLHALLYIFKTQSQNQITLESIQGDVSSDLCDAGFEQVVVDRAIRWILDLSKEIALEPEGSFNALDQLGTGVRIYVPYELDMFNLSCRQYILGLEQRGILSPANRERVIAQTIALHDSGIDVNLLQWVTMMVLYNQQDDEARQLAEMLALEELMVSYH